LVFSETVQTHKLTILSFRVILAMVISILVDVSTGIVILEIFCFFGVFVYSVHDNFEF